MMQVDRTEGSSPPGGGAPDRGWSLGVSGTGRLGGILGAALLVSAIVPAATFAAGYDPDQDVNSMANTTPWTGAAAWWTARYTGPGLHGALLDPRVNRVAGLATARQGVY